MLRRMIYSRSPISRLSPFIYTVPSDTKYYKSKQNYQPNKHSAQGLGLEIIECFTHILFEDQERHIAYLLQS
jgi:hypothetical protein